MSWLFPSGGQSTEASPLPTVQPTSIQDWFPLGLNVLISLLSKGLSRVFSSITIQKHQFLVTSLVSQMAKCLPTTRETQLQSPGWEDLLEKEMATHSSILAWKIPWTEEPVRLQSMGSQRIGHDWATLLQYFFFIRWPKYWSFTSTVQPTNIQDWFPLGLNVLISLLSKRLSSLIQHHNSKASILWH